MDGLDERGTTHRTSKDNKQKSLLNLEYTNKGLTVPLYLLISRVGAPTQRFR
jgi:hypothetical protein